MRKGYHPHSAPLPPRQVSDSPPVHVLVEGWTRTPRGTPQVHDLSTEFGSVCPRRRLRNDPSGPRTSARVRSSPPAPCRDARATPAGGASRAAAAGRRRTPQGTCRRPRSCARCWRNFPRDRCRLCGDRRRRIRSRRCSNPRSASPGTWRRRPVDGRRDLRRLVRLAPENQAVPGEGLRPPRLLEPGAVPRRRPRSRRGRARSARSCSSTRRGRLCAEKRRPRMR